MEVMLVLAIATIIIAFAVPSMLTLYSTSLSTTGREFSAFVNLCRINAIADRTIYRLGVVIDSPNEEEEFRQYATWIWDSKTKEYVQKSAWELLPQGLIFETDEANYINQSSYAEDDRSSVRGDFLLTQTTIDSENTFKETGTDDVDREIQFIQFSPAGRAKLPEHEGKNIIFLLRDSNSNAEITNWYQINVDTLTGRTQDYTP